MLRLSAGMLGWIGLGIIIAEVINNLKILEFNLNLLQALLPAAIYLVFELVLIRMKSQSSIAADNKYARVKSIYQWILGLVGLIFLISLPFLWWEVIKKLAQNHP